MDFDKVLDGMFPSGTRSVSEVLDSLALRLPLPDRIAPSVEEVDSMSDIIEQRHGTDDILAGEDSGSMNLGDTQGDTVMITSDDAIHSVDVDVNAVPRHKAAEALDWVLDIDARVGSELNLINYASFLSPEEQVARYEELLEAKQRLSIITPLLEALVREVDSRGVSAPSESDDVDPMIDVDADSKGKGKGKVRAVTAQEDTDSPMESMTSLELKERIDDILDAETTEYFEHSKASAIFRPRVEKSIEHGEGLSTSDALLARILARHERAKKVRAGGGDAQGHGEATGDDSNPNTTLSIAYRTATFQNLLDRYRDDDDGPSGHGYRCRHDRGGSSGANAVAGGSGSQSLNSGFASGSGRGNGEGSTPESSTPELMEEDVDEDVEFHPGVVDDVEMVETSCVGKGKGRMV